MGEPLPPTEIEKGAGARPEVSLTFDAGSDWKPTKPILEALAAHQVKATFFLTGEWVQENPKTARLIADQGHEIGNHSWDHPAFTKLSDDAVRDQLRRTETIIQEVVGRTSRPYFRPPLGDRDPRVRTLVGEEGFLTIYWTLDSRDSVDRGITAAQIKERVLGKTNAGSIVLLHCGSQATADALPGILDGLSSRGLKQVPLGRLLQE
jgi:peptidoglycan/xylan/chitin deacetylase (PgdA/CDA1 family)